MHALTRKFLLSQIKLLEQQVIAIKEIILHTPDENGNFHSTAQAKPEAQKTADEIDGFIGKLFQEFTPETEEGEAT
jgi:hypothetical protein